MDNISGKKIAILATHGFEQSELETPRERLKKAGASVEVVSLASGEIRGWDKKDWGRPVKVDKTLEQVSASDYDAVVLPGGQINPDLLRAEPKALKFIKDIFDAKKVVAAV
ncbi:MAG: DJ-1/PfpI family protein, partial [Bradyrhizobium sp.]|nr:DJ-1/PfpI family protein [Bradyrhizobium sp.]